MKFYTIGHSNHPIGRLIELLERNDITILIDVRSAPYSRFNPQFNQGNLQKLLPKYGIEYRYLGDTLSGRPTDPTCYIHQAVPKASRDYLHEVNYQEVMKSPWFIQGVGQLLEMANKQATCIMCSEGDPALCHRHHLIASYLLRYHPEVTILHFLRDGNLMDARTIRTIGGKNDAEQLSF
jgi:uncharacterized protein (DUF488 family)